MLAALRRSIQNRRAIKLQNMGADEINDLALELEGEDGDTNGKATKNKKFEKKKFPRGNNNKQGKKER